MAAYSYWEDGALKDLKTPGDVTLRSFAYHPTGLMNTATIGARTITNTWDADEHRVRVTTGGGTTEYTFVYDVTAGIPAVLQENTPEGTVNYIREPGGELIARVAGSAVHYYHFDELGSTRLLTDGGGNVTDRYTYDAYGAVLSHDRYANTIDQPYQYVGRLGYYTHTWAPEFGLGLLHRRFLDVELGRFTQYGSPYSFAANNPVSPLTVGDIIIRLPPPIGGQGSNPDEIDADIREVGYMSLACARMAQRAAQTLVEGYYAGKEKVWGDTLANAVMHCTMTCTMAARCGRSVATTVTNNHEKYNWNPRTGVMDLWNNWRGLQCFYWAPPKCPGRRRDDARECFNCCLRHRQAGRLYLLPAVPTPTYPGGIH